MHFEASADIQAPADAIWSILTDAPAYPTWGSDVTRVTMREEYSGPLVGMMSRSIPDLQPSFDKFVSGLKARAEAD